MATFHQIWPIPFHVLIHTRNKVCDFKQQNRWQNVVDITHRILKMATVFNNKTGGQIFIERNSSISRHTSKTGCGIFNKKTDRMVHSFQQENEWRLCLQILVLEQHLWCSKAR